MKLTDMNLWKVLNILSAIVTVIICAFLDTNPTYAIIPMLMAIFLAIEDSRNIHLHIHYHEKQD